MKGKQSARSLQMYVSDPRLRLCLNLPFIVRHWPIIIVASCPLRRVFSTVQLALSWSAAAVPQIIKNWAFVSFYLLNRKRRKKRKEKQSVRKKCPPRRDGDVKSDASDERSHRKQNALLFIRFVYRFCSLFLAQTGRRLFLMQQSKSDI